LSWDDLRRMAASGRWDIQEHAGVGHHEVRHGARGEKGAYYAFRRMTEKGRETFDAYRKRVTSDVLWGLKRLREEVPGFAPFSFAVPFGNFGQLDTNDSRIPTFFNSFLLRHFRAVFVVKPSGYTTQNTPRGRIGRMEVRTYTTAGRLYSWLRERLPNSSGQLRIPPLWCRPGWRCVPEQPPAVAGGGLNTVPAVAGSQAAASAGGPVAPSAGACPRPARSEAPAPSGNAESPLESAGGPSQP
jgi:biofilm PGA synthesis lipoprotein PgaB